MKPVLTEVERFRSMHAWANRILRIDLSTMRLDAQETEPYSPSNAPEPGTG